MAMNISGPPWVVDIPAGNALALTAAQVQAVQSAADGDIGGGILSLMQQAPADAMSLVRQVVSYSDSLTPTAATAATATQASNRARITWTDLKRLRGCTTDAAGYAVGAKTLNLASAGGGALYKGDVVTFAGQANEYTLLSGDANVSNGGSITLAGAGLAAAVPASATAITLVRRGCRCFLALDCDNAVEAVIATQAEAQRDADLVLGEALTVQSPVPISTIWASGEVTMLNGDHRLDIAFGD